MKSFKLQKKKNDKKEEEFEKMSTQDKEKYTEIEKEERMRVQAREKIDEELKGEKKKKTKELTSKEKSSCISLIVIVIFIVIMFSVFSDDSSKSSNSSSDSVDNNKAYIISQNFVENFLKSPSTADFPWAATEINDLGDNRYKVRAYVDAQNSFGAEIRNEWVTILKYNGGDWANSSNWTAEKIWIDGKIVYPNQ